MKKLIILFLALVLIAVPAAAEGFLVVDDSGLLQEHEVEDLELTYSDYTVNYGFTPALVTTDSFGGLEPDEYAGRYYDMQELPEDGMLLLVNLEEGYWYILTNGECAERISDWEVDEIGEELVPLIQDGHYYAAFLEFPKLSAEIYEANAPMDIFWDEEDFAELEDDTAVDYFSTIVVCMVVGLVIGLIAAGIMSISMKTVRQQSGAANYMRAGSMNLRVNRDIFLYSHVTRTEKPQNNSSGGGSSGGVSRGGSGGRL